MADSKTETATLLDLIAFNDSCPYESSFFEPLYQLYIPNDDRPHGYLVPSIVQKIPWTSDFRITHEKPRRVDVLDSSNGKDTSAAVNAAFTGVVNACLERDLFNLKAKMYEEFTVVGVPYPVRLYRFAAALFGIVSQGAHLTVYTRTSSGLKIWVPRRSTTIATYPNKLDSTVAGGVSAGTTPFETIVREAEEEASLPSVLVRRNIRAAGVLTYVTLLEKGQGEVGGLVKPDMVHVYDMEAAEDVIPKPHDDEVKSFCLMTPEEVKEALLKKEFKTNSAAVFIDFFIRHGLITADDEVNYTEMNMRLHRTLPFATAPRLF
ncbi:NUDIX hydrolase domain-like protein [Lasiosphaeria hispida]|uniref:NUDIX hydrolase domain-like protein n=1 Tax=Lasiosphaeria hispida TaxID=260671 RepID=A0AAJ0MGI0_9PEZI|nr:NUDIX hydrolase domain-like protein [Lasiosphaeria hispida]